MITFKQHLEISKHSKEEGGLLKYISSLPPEKKVLTTRAVPECYPLKMNGKASDYIKKEFKVYTNVMDLVLGQFIMVEQAVTGKTNYNTNEENDLVIAKLLLRPKHHEEFDNENKDDEIKNLNKILNTPVQEVYNVLAEFLSDREYVLFKQFSGVFYEISDEEKDEDSDESENTTAENLFAQQWYWYNMVRTLAKEDITMYEKIYMLKMDTVMPEMSFLAQRSKIESARRRQSEAMRKL